MTNPSETITSATPVVVDTNIVSYWHKRDPLGEPYREALQGRTLLLSFQTLAELFRWTEDSRWGASRRAALERSVQDFLVVDSTESLAREWARVMAEARRVGRPVNAADGWIAATARLLGLPLATHNRADFQALAGLDLISF